MTTACYPITKAVRTTEPTFVQEPLDTAAARSQCNLTHDPPELLEWIVAARRQVERDAALVCYTGTFTSKRDQFGWLDRFELPDIRPITSITSITYLDTAGATQTLDASSYVLSTSAIMPYVRLAYGESWPSVRGDGDGITVTFVAGHASVAVIPAEVKTAVKLALHVMFLQQSEQFAEAERQQKAYERQIALIRRETYS